MNLGKPSVLKILGCPQSKLNQDFGAGTTKRISRNARKGRKDSKVHEQGAKARTTRVSVVSPSTPPSSLRRSPRHQTSGLIPPPSLYERTRRPPRLRGSYIPYPTPPPQLNSLLRHYRPGTNQKIIKNLEAIWYSITQKKNVVY